MVRLKGRDDLSDKKDQLLAGFQSTDPVFSAAEDKTMLKQFYQAARRLHTSEKARTSEARTEFNKLTVLSRLRSPDQLAVLREFNIAKEKLIALKAPVAQSIVRHAEKRLMSL